MMYRQICWFRHHVQLSHGGPNVPVLHFSMFLEQTFQRLVSVPQFKWLFVHFRILFPPFPHTINHFSFKQSIQALLFWIMTWLPLPFVWYSIGSPFYPLFLRTWPFIQNYLAIPSMARAFLLRTKVCHNSRLFLSTAQAFLEFFLYSSPLLVKASI